MAEPYSGSASDGIVSFIYVAVDFQFMISDLINCDVKQLNSTYTNITREILLMYRSYGNSKVVFVAKRCP